MGRFDFINSQKLRATIFFGILIVSIAVHVAVHLYGYYSFPTPWPDESHFIWQAKAFADNNTLQSPELNPDRAVFWMPPGYFIVLGFFFKIFGVSLGIARTMSLLMVIVSFVFLVMIIRRYGYPIMTVLLCGIWFTNASFIACGNVARMEALLLLMVCVAFYLIQRGSVIEGLSVLAVTPVVHFNGLLFIAGGVVYAVMNRALGYKWKRIGPTGRVMTAIAALIWIGYMIYALLNREAFVHDMSFQFGRKMSRGIWSQFNSMENVLVGMMVLGASVYCIKKKMPVITLMALAVPCWLIFRIGLEMWYDVFYSIAYLIFSMIFIQVWIDFTHRQTPFQSRALKWAFTGLFFLLLLCWNYKNDNIENLVHYPNRMEYHTMYLPNGADYVTDADISSVKEYLLSVADDNRPLVVQFAPRADAFFFLSMDSTLIRHSNPLFYDRKPDVHIIHISRYLPANWKHIDKEFTEAGAEPRSDEYIILSRDETETWYGVMDNWKY